MVMYLENRSNLINNRLHLSKKRFLPLQSSGEGEAKSGVSNLAEVGETDLHAGNEYHDFFLCLNSTFLDLNLSFVLK